MNRKAHDFHGFHCYDDRRKPMTKKPKTLKEWNAWFIAKKRLSPSNRLKVWIVQRLGGFYPLTRAEATQVHFLRIDSIRKEKRNHAY